VWPLHALVYGTRTDRVFRKINVALNLLHLQQRYLASGTYTILKYAKSSSSQQKEHLFYKLLNVLGNAIA
jgi:hypothetical protein